MSLPVIENLFVNGLEVVSVDEHCLIIAIFCGDYIPVPRPSARTAAESSLEHLNIVIGNDLIYNLSQINHPYKAHVAKLYLIIFLQDPITDE